MPNPPGYEFKPGRDRSRRKGAVGFERSPLTPEPIHTDNAPVVLPPGAHGPADQLRFSDLSRGAVRKIRLHFGPPRHDSWPISIKRSLAKLQRSMEGNRPQDARIIRRRQYPYPRQTARPRTDVPEASSFTSIIEGSY